MPVPCFYHPDTPSTATCAQCGMPICALDTEVVAGKMVCKNCVQAVRARVERELLSAPAPAHGEAMQEKGYYVAPTTAADPGKLALGIAVSLVIGLVSAIAIEKILFSTGVGLSLLYIFMGYGIGYGLHKLTGEGGPKMAAIAVGIMLVSLLVSHVILVQDMINREYIDQGGGIRIPLGAVFVPVLRHLGIMHWVLIAIGLYSCFQGMMRRQ